MSSETKPSLMQLWQIAMRAKADVAIAAARADRLAAEFNEALAIENAEQNVPEGYQIDYLGDGEVKRADACHKIPQAKR